MAKYIDKEVLLERMNRTRPYEGENGSFERHRRLQWLADLGQVNMCPASDVSEVVRCKECKHREYDDFMKEFVCDLDAADPYERSRCAEDDEWFCKDGERKDG